MYIYTYVCEFIYVYTCLKMRAILIECAMLPRDNYRLDLMPVRKSYALHYTVFACVFAHLTQLSAHTLDLSFTALCNAACA